MLLEGLLLFAKTSDKVLWFDRLRYAHPQQRNVLVGWIIPALIVLVAAAVGFSGESYMSKKDSDGNYDRCWLNKESTILIYSVLVPCALVLSVNLAILLKVGVFVNKMSRKGNKLASVPRSQAGNSKHLMASFKAVVMLAPVLGFSLVFAFVAGK